MAASSRASPTTENLSKLLENMSLTYPLPTNLNIKSTSPTPTNPIIPIDYNVLKYLKVESEPFLRFNNLALTEYGNIIKEIASGSYGVIFSTDKNYIIKVMINDDSPSLLTDVLREVVYSKSLNHPGIIKYLDYYDSNQSAVRHYMKGHVAEYAVYSIVVMPRYTGSLLVIDAKGLIDVLQSVAFQIITSMAYLSSRNIIHADIKPENIFVQPCPHNPEFLETVIADFGLATDRECLVNIRRSTKIASLYYRPPEIAVAYINGGSAHYNSKVDVWSIACTIYEFYTGKILFEANWQVPSNTKQNENLLLEIFKVLGPPLVTDGFLYNHYVKIGSPVSVPQNLTDNADLNDLLSAMLQYNPAQRISFSEAQVHPIFSNLKFTAESCYQGLITGAIPCIDKTILFERDYDYQRLKEVKISNLKILTPWLLFAFSEYYKLDRGIETSKIYILALEILYKYLCQRYVSPRNLQLTGVSCLYLASVFQSDAMNPYFLFRVGAGAYELEEVVNTAQTIFRAIDYDLLATSTWDYLNNQNRVFVRDGAILANKILMLAAPILRVYMPQYRVDKTLANKCINVSIMLTNFSKDEEEGEVDEILSTTDELDAIELMSEIVEFYADNPDNIGERIMRYDVWNNIQYIVENQ